MNKRITILTPTYNRRELLTKCYESLKKQTRGDFEWLIVDDGSNDGTAETVRDIIDEGKIFVRYYHKENGGKHTAINFGVLKAQTPLIMILDSDDSLTSEAIETVLEIHEKYKDEKSICGFTFLKQYPDGKSMGDFFPKEGRYNYIAWRVNGVVTGEQCDVFYTDVMKEYPFSVYPNEKYIGESTAWIRMAALYDMIACNKGIYVADYLEGGLTKKGRAMRCKCPRGGMEYANLCMQKGCSLKRKLRSAVLYNAYASFASIPFSEALRKSNDRFLTVITCWAGRMLKRRWEKTYQL